MTNLIESRRVRVRCMGVAHCVAQWDGERWRNGEKSVERRRLKIKGIEGNGSFRNRQVESSTLSLGSRYLLWNQ